MKRFFALILALNIVMTLCCCTSNINNKLKNSTDSEVPSLDSSNVSELDGIAQRDIHSIEWQTVSFTHANSGDAMNIVFPNDWSFESADGKYNISRNGKLIGTVSSDPSPIPQKKLDVKSGSVENLKYNRAVHKNGDRYTYVVCFSYTADTTITRVTLEVDYAELCNAAVTRMVNDSLLYSTSNNIQGDFTLDPQNNSKRIMVCGNSFIGSSQLIQWFNQMCQASGNGYSMNSGTASMVAADGSYANKEVKNGEYAAILLCGFYSDNQIQLLEKLKPLCEESNTLLIIFPAHNEVPSSINKALSENPDIPYIGWKDEIQTLIDIGVDYEEMCIDDAHQHTTHLGGYVGAHMIYRTFFKRTPPMISGTSTLSFDDVKRLLGEYVTTGDPYSVRESSSDLKLKF